MAAAFDFTRPLHKTWGFKTIRVQLPSGLFKGYIYRYGELVAVTAEPAGWEQLERWTRTHINSVVAPERAAREWQAQGVQK